jgi:YHS domain-containing protein
MVIRLILVLIVAYLGIKTFLLVSRHFRRRAVQRTSGSTEKTIAVNEMVRDPVCGVYIAIQDALTVYRNGTQVFFCSEECRRQFLNDQR